MKEFIDQTSTTEGTPINRASLMAMQGFIASTITFGTETISERNSDGALLRTTFSGNTVRESLVGDTLQTIVKTTTLRDNDVLITISGG